MSNNPNRAYPNFSLPQFNQPGGPTLSIAPLPNSQGVLPSFIGDGTAVEIALDLEWAHAIAPQANILLVEVSPNVPTDLITSGVDFARRQPGVSVVSISFSIRNNGAEIDGRPLDSYFTTPANHIPVAFVAASGDSGMPSYPATSPNVLSVGGTSLPLDRYGSYPTLNFFQNPTGDQTVPSLTPATFSNTQEGVWNNAFGSTGAGDSAFEPQPSFQTNAAAHYTYLQFRPHRTTPDVAYNADPNTGYLIFYTSPSTNTLQTFIAGAPAPARRSGEP
jgi:subtilase family serine protease